MRYFFIGLMLLFWSSTPSFANDTAKQLIVNGENTKLEQLISQGLDVNARDEHGNTLLFYALTQQQNLKIADILIDAGADVNMPSAEGLTPLLIATALASEIQKKLSSISGTISGVRGQILRAQLNEQQAYLMKRSMAVLQLLLDNGADVNQETPRGTALMSASTSELNYDLVKALLKAGAKVNQQDRYGRTALFYANAFGCDEISTLLIKSGADINITDNYMRSYMEVEKKDIEDNY